MKTREWFAEKLKEIERRMAEVKANYNALEGAEQFCKQAIAEIDAELGLPLESLFPGGTMPVMRENDHAD